MRRPELEVKDGVLTVFRELEGDYDVAFDRACSDLAASEETELLIDLSRVRHITSACIGMMAALYIRTQSMGKKLTITAQGQVLNVLRISGFANLMRLTDSGRFKARTPD